jgi:eukaryotic-like serine/threonine-protein kinase
MAKISTNTKTDLFTHIGIIVCIFIAFFLAFFFIYLPWSTNHGQSITVPKLDNMKLANLEDFLDDHNLRMEVSDCVFVAGAEPLTVKSYFPKEGSKVKEGRKIYVTIYSENAPLIRMPKITDLSLNSAQTQIIQVGLEKGQITFKPDLAENTVLEQLFNGVKIEPGTLIPKGSKIDLVVGNGSGSSQIPIPNVLGMDLEAAELVINGSNLQIGTIAYDDKSTKPAGTVIKQNPDKSEGTTIEESFIDLVIAGPDPDKQ